MLAIICTMPENQSDRTFMLELYERFFRLMFFTARKYHLHKMPVRRWFKKAL